MSASLIYLTLFKGTEEDFVEARANVQPDVRSTDVIPDVSTIYLANEHVVREAIERRKRHGVIGYT